MKKYLAKFLRVKIITTVLFRQVNRAQEHLETQICGTIRYIEVYQRIQTLKDVQRKAAKVTLTKTDRGGTNLHVMLPPWPSRLTLGKKKQRAGESLYDRAIWKMKILSNSNQQCSDGLRSGDCKSHSIWFTVTSYLLNQPTLSAQCNGELFQEMV